MQGSAPFWRARPYEPAMMECVDDEDGNSVKAEDEDKVAADRQPLQVDISDALSEKEKVKFTVHTSTTLPHFKNSESSVVREHDEFIWLHNVYVENKDYAGIIIPPAPPCPDFDTSREKLQQLGEGESTMTKEEFAKMKQELEAEYLAIFKKTVVAHEVFLCRLAEHPVLGMDSNLQVFLEYEQELGVRGKNVKERLGDFLRGFVKTADELLIVGVKDTDDFFEKEKNFILEYHGRVKDSANRADRMTHALKDIAEDYSYISYALCLLATHESGSLHRFLENASEMFERYRKLQNRVASDQDLKLSDLLKYYARDTQAAKDLLYRRTRAQLDTDSATKGLERARLRGRDIQVAEALQETTFHTFETISSTARKELAEFKQRRVAAFRKNLIETAVLELKHARTSLQVLNNVLTNLKEC
uniref:sorting nexin-6-like n=2 Tax=Myxine glutinosa TaxID=7769 RepID=UPI00358DDCA0